MTFLAVIIALFIDRALWDGSEQRGFAWFDRYCRRATGTTAGQWLCSRPLGATLILTPPLLLVAWLQYSLLDGLGDFFEFIFAVAVLLFSLGPRDLGRDVETFLHARDADRQDDADTCAAQLCLGDISSDEPARSLAIARAVVVAASHRLIGPLFWFVVFGATGALAYRLIRLHNERFEAQQCPAEMRTASRQLLAIADWAPARISAIGYAVAGSFDAVSSAWQHFEFEPETETLTEADALLAETGLSALATYREAVTEDDPHDIPPVVEDALALVWRSLTFWIAVTGVGALISAIS